MYKNVGGVRLLAILLVLTSLMSAAPGGQRPQERVLAIVHMIGSGTVQDPRRPLFAPIPNDFANPPDPNHRPAIFSYRFEAGDDGRTAIVEYTGFDRLALRKAIKSDDPNFRIVKFDGSTPAEIDQELKKVKKSFDLDRFLHGFPAGLPSGGARWKSYCWSCVLFSLSGWRRKISIRIPRSSQLKMRTGSTTARSLPGQPPMEAEGSTPQTRPADR